MAQMPAGQGSFTGPVVLVTSPHAGHAQGVERLTGLLEARGVRVGQHIAIGELYEQRPQGTAWRDMGFTAAVAAGGDGTVGALATHLAGSGLALGILPMGTANDVARSLGIPLDLDEACRMMSCGHTEPVDAGQVVSALTKPGALTVNETTSHPHGEDVPSPRAGAYFLHAVTLGLNVEFARLATDTTRRERLRGLTYPASALEALAHYRPTRVKLHVPPHGDAHRDEHRDEHDDGEGQSVELSVLTLLTINTPVFGGPMNLHMPWVAFGDDRLDFLIIEAPDRTHAHHRMQEIREGLGRIFEEILHRRENGQAGKPFLEAMRTLSLPGVYHFQARSLLIETDEPVDLTMDGELRAHTPALVRVAPERMRIFAPESVHVGQHENTEQADREVGEA
jgi:diacylglycerol kinase family enzyme